MSPTFAPSSLTGPQSFPKPEPDMRQATYREFDLPLVPAKAGIQRWIPAGVYPRPRSGAGMSGVWMLACVASLMFSSVQPAAADFRLCNNTASRVGVAVG